MKGGILHWTCPECLLDIFPFQNCDNQSISELFFSNSIIMPELWQLIHQAEILV
jgi:hypothetical protein